MSEDFFEVHWRCITLASTLAILAFKQCDPVGMFVKASVDRPSVFLHILMQFFELSSNRLDRCGETDHCLAGFAGAAREARYGHASNANGGTQDRSVDFDHWCLGASGYSLAPGHACSFRRRVLLIELRLQCGFNLGNLLVAELVLDPADDNFFGEAIEGDHAIGFGCF